MIELIPDLNETALITEDYSLSYKEYKRTVFSLCGTLIKAGIRPKDRVGVISQNSLGYIILIMALIHMGAIVVPINTRWPEAQIKDALDSIGCDHLIISKDIPMPRINCNLFYLSDLLNNSKNRPLLREYDISLDREVTIIFTSGSSGRPKAVLHTLKNHYYSALGSNMNISFGPGDIWGISLPLYHVGGLSIIFRAILGGGSIAVSIKKEPILTSIKKFGITHISLVPTQLYRMLKNEEEIKVLKKLKAILIGGAPARENLIKRAKELNLPVFTTYGSTEMASQVTTTRPNDTLEHLLTSGRVLPYRELKISDDGEILVKGQTLFKGYTSKEGLDRPFTADGWFRTGDLGFLDSDGYLTITGRKDNMFISGGENIQPEEIENRLSQFDGIIDAVVIPIDDEEWGQRPVAFIYADKELKEDEIKNWLENYLPRYKIPDHIFHIPENIKKRGIKLDRGYLKGLAKRIMGRA